MLESLLRDHADEFLGALTGAGGLKSGEAQSLLPPALDGIGQAVGSGGLDLSSLLGGGSGDAVSEILGRLDLAGIASAAGIDQARAETGLASLIPVVLSLLGDKAGGVDDILAMLSGGSGEAGAVLGALGGLTGKLFGK
jgi:hypothetical protein